MKIRSLVKRKSVEIQSPAKLNLVLEVLFRRSDGYHQISSIMCPINLWDSLEVISQNDPGVRLELQIPEPSQSSQTAWQIPTDRTNLVVKAVEMVRQELGVNDGCLIRLRKKIPAAAGLGGGSGNAAAAVVACLLLWSSWNRPLAQQLCQRLGSDTNLFLGSEQGFGMMLAEGRGEKISLLPESPSLSFWMTNPPQGCSTQEVYKRLKVVGNCGKIEEFIRACQNGQTSKIGAALFNALQLPASGVNPWIDRQLTLLRQCGCSTALVTGSGSSCFGLAPDGGNFIRLQTEALKVGVSRVYEVNAWYGESIEQQLDQPDESGSG
jgi:4-diphosphocytidyl-2-C-methyl-D-erythritol kinase